jgi:predicted enzyme related to lactoylglutathione lyase
MTQPVTYVEINSPDLATTSAFVQATIKLAREHGGHLVVEPFTLPGVGMGCYLTDPAGVLSGLHAYDPDA